MSHHHRFIIAVGAVCLAMTSAVSFSREDPSPRGADRPRDVRPVVRPGDPGKAPIVTTNADRRGGQTGVDDNNRNRGGGTGRTDDGPGHH